MTERRIALLAAIVLMLAAAGFVGGRSLAERASAATAGWMPNTIMADDLSIGVPEGWTRYDLGERPPGWLPQRAAVAAGPAGRRSPSVIAWITATDITVDLLPVAAVPPGPPAAARKGTAMAFPDGRSALTFEDLRLYGLPPLRYFAIPTERGVLTFGCAPEVTWSTCARIASSSGSAGFGSLSLAPDVAAASQLAEVFGGLRRAAAGPMRRLSEARQPDTAREHASSIASAYGTAADGVAHVRADSGQATIVFDELVRKLRRVSDSYRALAEAARDGRPRAYDAAAERVRGDHDLLIRAANHLRRRGYDLKVES